MVCVSEDTFGCIEDPLTKKVIEIRRFTLKNKNKLSIQVITRGATITSIKFPDKNNITTDVCLGFDSVQDYVRNRQYYMGATLGRVANRISRGRFHMGSGNVCVSKNWCHKHHLNGGFIGFDSVVWDVTNVLDNGVEMKHCSSNNHEGYPGDVTACIKFTLDDFNNFRVLIFATSTECTPINISNNIYFNLAGHDQGQKSLGEHLIMIKADKVVDTDDELIPTGLLMPVTCTPYDLREFTYLAKILRQFRKCPLDGVEKHYVTDVLPGLPETVVKILHPCTGRWIEICTNQPTLLLNTANDLPNMESTKLPLIGKDGAIYEKHGAFSLQTQQYPDAVNNKSFPKILLQPCDKYLHEISYTFGVCKECPK